MLLCSYYWQDYALEILKGTSQYRYGPHSVGWCTNYATTPIDLGKRYYASAFYGSGDDVVTYDYFNYEFLEIRCSGFAWRNVLQNRWW